MPVKPTSKSAGKVRHLITNTASLVTNDMVNRAITFIVYALIARYLGAYEFGQMSLTLTIFYLLQSLAPVGLKIMLVREVASNKERSGEYLVNGSLVAFITSVIAFILMGCFLILMDYSRDTVVIILVVSLGLIPYSITAVCEALLQSHEKIKYITAANVPVSIIRGFAAFAMLAGGLSLIWIGVLFFVTFTATLVFEWLLVSKHVARPEWNIDRSLLRQISRASITFLGLQTVIAVTGSILPIFLSKSSGEIEVGLLNAANQLMAPILLISQSTVMSLFPRMCQKFNSSPDGLGKISERLLEILFTFTMPCTIGLFFFAQQALLILYEKAEFTRSATILQIMVWILVFRAITSVLGRVLMASQRERTLLNIMIAEAILTLGLCFWLIPVWKLAGAAYVAIIIGLLDLVLHIGFTWKVSGNIHYGRSFWKSILASLAMSGLILLFMNNEVNIWITILISGAVYSLFWAILAILENGSWPRVLKHYQVRQ